MVLDASFAANAKAAIARFNGYAKAGADPEFDRGLLAATGRARPRVVILPTASWPDGEDAFERWAELDMKRNAAR